MSRLDAGQAFPKMEVSKLGGGTLTLGVPTGGNDWQLVSVYRGLHCPKCKSYLERLNELAAQFREIGVDVVTVSSDPEAKAQAMVDEKGLDIPVGYAMTIEQMGTLGLYVTDPRSPQETDRPFAEPGMFVINGDGNIQILDISNAPFARPELEVVLNGIKFIRENDYPIRGMHRTS